jgi:GT2 family glycosyltransferase
MSVPTTLSVVIPTYQRPDWIQRAVRSLAAQDRPPEEVIPVARDTDLPTHDAIASLQRLGLPFQIRPEQVTAPGFMPPVERGLSVAQGDVIAVMDDDAEATEGWAARILGNYVDDSIGAVGGRCINMYDGKPAVVPDVDRVGYVTSLGKFVGNMYCQPTFIAPVDVDFLLGGNMSFRHDVAKRIEFDMQLNRNVAQGYEVDVGLQVRAMGRRVIFDPRLTILHYSAPRATAGLRQSNSEGARWYAFNHARVALRRLTPLRGSVSFAYQLMIGERKAPGLLPMAIQPLARRLAFDTACGAAALAGRWTAFRSVIDS